jgi:hypothetical protein
VECMNSILAFPGPLSNSSRRTSFWRTPDPKSDPRSAASWNKIREAVIDDFLNSSPADVLLILDAPMTLNQIRQLYERAGPHASTLEILPGGRRGVFNLSQLSSSIADRVEGFLDLEDEIL